MDIPTDVLERAKRERLVIRLVSSTKTGSEHEGTYIENDSLKPLAAQLRAIAQCARECGLLVTHHFRSADVVSVVLVPEEWIFSLRTADALDPRVRLRATVERLQRSRDMLNNLATANVADGNSRNPSAQHGDGAPPTTPAHPLISDEKAEGLLYALAQGGTTLEIATGDDTLVVPPLPPSLILVSAPARTPKRKFSGRIVAVIGEHALLDSGYALRSNLFSENDIGRRVSGEGDLVKQVLRYEVLDAPVLSPQLAFDDELFVSAGAPGLKT